ncbi:MAG: hydroxylacyl-CoA dehydrogenase [Actinobacteria bacterium 13_2_20CM_2_71_6]|nr:MAG: hydroxylacyl-CoA dehydrogenase [Actinobacteria bacterium 13_2_20CM_2_71_6]
MSAATTTAVAPTDAQLYHEVQQFYAYQMQLLDDGAAQQWATTFTEAGVFAANAHPEPVRGRDAITAAAARAIVELADKGIQRRHWLGMVHVTREGAAVRARSYALVFETPKGGQAAVRMSTVCEDVLVHDGVGWLVAERYVTRDDLS